MQHVYTRQMWEIGVIRCNPRDAVRTINVSRLRWVPAGQQRFDCTESAESTGRVQRGHPARRHRCWPSPLLQQQLDHTPMAQPSRL